MRHLVFGAVALVVTAGAASAADMQPRYAKAPPPMMSAPVQVYNWTGFYIGGHVGGAFAGDSSLFGSNGRFLGGVQGGADYQFSQNWVLGIEAQYSWLSGSGGAAGFPGGFALSQRDRELGSVTGRLGYTWGPTMLYAKGGYAWRDNTLGLSGAGAPVAFTTSGNRSDGYTVGGGLEYMFAPNWSAKAEYQYYNFGSTTVTGGPASVVGARWRDDDHTVKVGLNYRFGWGGPAVSRY
jgi:outer membrane immunogenic protein